MSSNNIIQVQLRNSLLKCKAMLKKDDDALISLIDDALMRLEQPIQLAIIGKISSSKSTLVNAILGNPQTVATGCAELTYNVNWLTYGDADEDIKVVFKDGSFELKPRKDWEILANRLSNEEETKNQELKKYIDRIKYIRVPYPAEILKKVNIIDTPGLYSTYQTDSKNTISFLKEVKPDAVVMVLSKSVLVEDLETLNIFQGKSGKALFSLNPLNAIGLLAKMDTYWKSTEKDKTPYDTANRVINKLIENEPQLENFFFSILPISALLGGLTSEVITEDYEVFKVLAKLPEEKLVNILKSIQHFKRGCEELSLFADTLCTRYGLYGIFVIVSFLKKNQGASNEVLIKELKNVSGHHRFMRLLLSHFRDRSVLIKTQNTVQAIIDKCEQLCRETRDENCQKQIDTVQAEILTTLMSIHEYKEWYYLMKIYNGEYEKSDNTMIEEYKTICGEYGNAVIDKLDLPPACSIEDMQNKANSRTKHWNTQYNIARIRNPKDAELCRVMSEAYNVLGQRITEMAEKGNEAKRIIEMVNNFFYGE